MEQYPRAPSSLPRARAGRHHVLGPNSCRRLSGRRSTGRAAANAWHAHRRRTHILPLHRLEGLRRGQYDFRTAADGSYTAACWTAHCATGSDTEMSGSTPIRRARSRRLDGEQPGTTGTPSATTAPPLHHGSPAPGRWQPQDGSGTARCAPSLSGRRSLTSWGFDRLSLRVRNGLTIGGSPPAGAAARLLRAGRQQAHAGAPDPLDRARSRAGVMRTDRRRCPEEARPRRPLHPCLTGEAGAADPVAPTCRPPTTLPRHGPADLALSFPGDERAAERRDEFPVGSRSAGRAGPEPGARRRTLSSGGEMGGPVALGRPRRSRAVTLRAPGARRAPPASRCRPRWAGCPCSPASAHGVPRCSLRRRHALPARRGPAPAPPGAQGGGSSSSPARPVLRPPPPRRAPALDGDGGRDGAWAIRAPGSRTDQRAGDLGHPAPTLPALRARYDSCARAPALGAIADGVAW